ncbi:hypothetical protein EST38_g10915 [Candolleomyces aberdarensis]|uniref:F-box domain-containing protein n=1 Tax=Candolleomyces aberdarensis TaxID=2316362 RepID=A0A4Q2D661_9AGAR|nr:hypothetical protein EST38_g10915 [Candolleomyces aberdarensis]
MRSRFTVTEAASVVHKSELAQYDKKVQAIQDMTFNWIVRSANCPLDIALSCEDTHFGRDPEDNFYDASISEQFPQPACINPIMMDLILSVANRWKRASFDLAIASWNSPLLKLLETAPANVPQLEDLQLVLVLPQPFSEETRWDGLTPRVGLFKAPCLRALAISRLWAPSDQLPVNFGALTELYLGPYIDAHSTDHYSMTPSHALAVLKACHNLVRCFITLDSGSRYGDFPFEPHNSTASSTLPPLDEKITLPYLKSMSIQGSFLPQGFASSFNLPSLCTLFILCHPGIPQNEDNSGLVDWVRNFGDMLTEVTFEHSTLTEAALLYCLEHLPNVETLRLVDTGMMMHGNWSGEMDAPRSALITDHILARLTPKPDADETSQSYCPKLQHFSYRMAEIECTEEGLLDFIAGRRQFTNFTSPLKRVVVKFNTAQRMDIREELVNRGVDLEGLSLLVRYNEPRTIPFQLTSDKRLENLLPEDRMVAGDYWVPGGLEWWQ